MKYNSLQAFSFLFCVMICAARVLAQPMPNAQTIHETGQQYKEGNPLLGASDNMAIGSQAMFEANLKAKKNIVDMKPNTFLSMWNNPAFAVQFEKFLSAPAETSDDAKLYRQRINKIMELLSPGKATKANQDEAFNLLPLASEFESDANNCTTIHDAVYAAANANVEIQKLTEVDQELGKQLGVAQYNYRHDANSLSLSTEAVSKTEQANYDKNQVEVRAATLDPSKSTVASLKQTIQRNQQQIANAEIQAKFALQSLILQLFVQRRYQHVIIIDRFYRALFDDGDQSLEQFQQMADKMGYNKAAGQVKITADADPKGSTAMGNGNNGHRGVGASAGTGPDGTGASVGNDYNNSGGDATALSGSGLHLGIENLSVESAQNALTTGMKTASRTFKSLSQLDAFANEAIRDVNEGVKVYKFLLDKNELESASSQLASVFVKGEYLPSVRLLTQDEKRKTLAYAQLCNRLVNAANSGNIDALSEVVTGMKEMNPSFDDAEIRAKLQGVKTASSLLVAQAKVAASKGDLQAVQTQITRAAALWPNNPEVTNFSADMSKLGEKASPQVQAINDFLEDFRRLKPDILAVTEDDQYGDLKRALCAEVGAEYIVLPKTPPQYEPVSTSQLVKWIRAPKDAPLRVDFAGGWLDVPRHARPGGFIVNCAISPKVSLREWCYERNAGLGGSGAWALLNGHTGVEEEIKLGVGWQDPAVIQETGLCVWRSGLRPSLEFKSDGSMLRGRMALWWSGHAHDTPSMADQKRDYSSIESASKLAREAVLGNNLDLLGKAVAASYENQLHEGMSLLPEGEGCLGRKYCGGGFGGYALYLFGTPAQRESFLVKTPASRAIEPFSQWE